MVKHSKVSLLCAPGICGIDNRNNSKQMILQYWAGMISPKIILLKTDSLEAWANDWLKRAQEAEKAGNKLIVFEIPENELLYDVASLDTVLQRHNPVASNRIDPMLFDLSFYKALMESK